MVYEDLKKKFENLSDDNKNALLVYKSRLGRAINSLDIDEKEIIDIYNKYKELLSTPRICLCLLLFLRMYHFLHLIVLKKALKI